MLVNNIFSKIIGQYHARLHEALKPCVYAAHPLLVLAMQIGLLVPTVLNTLTLVGICTNRGPFGSVTDYLGLGLFALGSALETVSELQRKAFKAKESNKGKVYTGGLFSLARHINYTGEILWCDTSTHS